MDEKGETAKLQAAASGAGALGEEITGSITRYLATKDSSVASVVGVLETVKFTLLIDCYEEVGAEEKAKKK